MSHAHFDHIDTRTLHKISKRSGTGFQPVPHRQDAGATKVVTAPSTRDLLRWMRFREVTELRWGESHELQTDRGSLCLRAFRVNHWGARLRNDNYRGYNGYILERNNRRIIFGGDTALTESFAALRDDRPYDLAIMSIGAYNPWIRSHADPEQVVGMCNAAGVTHIMPVHHQTFRLSFEPFREPIERFQAALRNEPHRIALREIGEIFILPR